MSAVLLSACQRVEVNSSRTLQSPPFKCKGSGTNRETQAVTEPSSQTAVVAWPRDPKVFKGLYSLPRWPRFRPWMVRMPWATALQMRNQDEIRAQAGPGTTQGPQGLVWWTCPHAPQKPSVGRVVRNRHSNVSWNPRA